MSFILDAIAKSERERQQQEVPDARILAMPVTQPQQQGQRLPYYIIALLLILVIGLLIWMQFFNRPSVNSPLPAISQTVKPQQKPVDSAGILDSANTISRTVPATETATETGAADITRISPLPETRLQEPRVLSQAPGGSVDVSKPQTGSSLPDSEAQAVEQPSIASLPAKADLANNHPETVFPDQTDKPESVVKIEREITPLNELPEDVRRDLPVVAFTGHLYSTNPRLSNVMVDGGRSLIAGQQITDELYLYKVTPDGVIVDFRGFLIETGVLQNWSLK